MFFKKGSLGKATQLFGVKGNYENKLMGAIKQGQQKLEDSKNIVNNYAEEAKEKYNPLEKK